MRKTAMTNTPIIRLAACLALALLAPLSVGPASAQQAARPAPPADYTLGGLDLIEVSVVGLPELTTKTRIAQDGTVTLPLIGGIAVDGLSTREAADAIAARYAAGGYAANPSVRVEVIEFQSRKVSVLGQVNNQGLVILDRPYSVAEVLARAGGLTAEAADSVTIVRQAGKGWTEKLTIDLTKLVAGTGATTLVRSGDLVFVPRAPTVSVIGAVNKAGVYRLTAGMNVQQALAAAGDIARIGTRSGLRIRRPDGNATKLIDVKLDDPVKPGDVVMVRERIF